MKRGSLSCFAFALACVAAFWLSAKILGPGMWGTIFLGVGILVAASPFFRPIRGFGGAIALIAAILALLAALLGLLAATIGGSFRLPQEQALLLAALGFMGVFGIVAFRQSLKTHDAA